MEVKKMLARVYGEVEQLESLRRQKDALVQDSARIKAIRYDKDKVSGGKQSDLSDMLIGIENKAARLEERIIYKMDQIMKHREELYQLMEQLPDSPAKIAVQEHYLYRVPWGIVSSRLHYNKEYTKQLAYKFILRLEEVADR